MKHKIFLTIIFIGLGAVFGEIKAQQMLITIDKPFVVKSLSGVITNANGETMRELTVTRFTSDWKKEIESVETDINSKFDFKKLPAGIYYLKLSASGFNELRVKVKVTKNSKAELNLKLEVST